MSDVLCLKPRNRFHPGTPVRLKDGGLELFTYVGQVNNLDGQSICVDYLKKTDYYVLDSTQIERAEP